ncbi:hypothetical protein [Micromonospora sp. NPDC005299]|uniref:hypothetical protein n=1 Tax=Micromonospora sp. NPDC005299 TaxID=3364231 RepID=UPI00367F6958
MNTALKSVLLVGTVLLAAGCSSSEKPAAPEPAASAVGKAAGGQAPSGSMEEIVSLTETLKDRLSADVRKCLADEGFPQQQQAFEMTAQRTPQARREPLRIDPLEMGPYTAEQARRYGMVGSVLLFVRSEPGTVVSKDPSFDAALESCRKEFSRKANGDVGALLSQSAEVQDEIRRGFLDATAEPILKLVTERLDCVRKAGYPQLDPKNAEKADDFAVLLRDAGVQTASISQSSHPEPKIKKGEIVVVPPSDPGTYTPPAPEVGFALAYVTCGEQQDFTKKLEQLQEEPRKKLVDRYAVKLTGISATLRDAARNAS